MTAFNNLQELIDLLGDAPGVSELSISGPGGAQITIKRPPAFPQSPLNGVHPDASNAADLDGSSAVTPQAAEAVPPAREQAQSSGSAHAPAVITANRVGVYHSGKSPVGLNDVVAAGQIVGYIESMKLMNEVRADTAGTVAEQLVDEGMPVEYGQPLFRIARSGER